MRQMAHPKPGRITLTGVLAALADPVRLSIVAELAALPAGAERAWGDIDVRVCSSTLSHHVKVLRLAGVINHRKDGTRCFICLRPELEEVFPGLLKSVLDFARTR
jgi:DNA-binding transcriptional ArsR family regulator